MNYPKVLVIGINPWIDNSGINTLIGLFEHWDKEKVALVYTRADLPNTKVCSRFFQISENDVLKSVLKPWRQTGRVVFNTPSSEDSGVEEEHKRYAKAQKKHSYFLSVCRELVWTFGHWKSKALKNFVREFAPDVLFVPVYPTVFMGKIQRYIKKLTGKPIVCYLADDNYSYEACKGFWAYLHRLLLRKQVKYLATHCKEMFVIVDKEKEETDRLFGTDSVIMTKGIDFTGIAYRAYTRNTPLKFVYTGKLIIGRDKTLALIADLLNEINAGEQKATLEIYSPDVVDEATMERLNRGCSKHCGCVSREEVAEIQSQADVLIFAEALEGKDGAAARLSFSTKITDYLAASKCVLAVGGPDIAPIDYFVRNDSALVATNAAQLERQLRLIIDNPSIIEEYGRKAFDCAKRNHDKAVLDERFLATMRRAVE